MRGLPFFVLIPAFVLRRLGVKRRGFGFSGGDLKPAIPFLLIYTAAFLVSGLTVERWVFLLYAVLYSGFQEEFFFRGVMHPAVHSCHQETRLGDGTVGGLVCPPAHPGLRFPGIPHCALGLKQRGQHGSVWGLDGLWGLPHGNALALDAYACPQQCGGLLVKVQERGGGW